MLAHCEAARALRLVYQVSDTDSDQHPLALAPERLRSLVELELAGLLSGSGTEKWLAPLLERNQGLRLLDLSMRHLLLVLPRMRSLRHLRLGAEHEIGDAVLAGLPLLTALPLAAPRVLPDRRTLRTRSP